MNDERRQRRLDRARFLVGAEQFIALSLPMCLFVAAPGALDTPMFAGSLLVQVIPWVGVLGYVLGLVWMFRLSSPRVEAGERDWRYREF